MNILLILILTLRSLIPSGAEPYEEWTEDYYVCSTPACLERAMLINASINNSVDPCTDFFSYACGGWASKHKPSSRGWYGVVDLLEGQRTQKMKRKRSLSNRLSTLVLKAFSPG
ncbi:neprilysin-1-like [Amblyomma americanum]